MDKRDAHAIDGFCSDALAEAYAALKAENERLERIVKFVNLKANMAIMQEMAHTKQTLLTTLNYIYDGTLAPPEGE